MSMNHKRLTAGTVEGNRRRMPLRFSWGKATTLVALFASALLVLRGWLIRPPPDPYSTPGSATPYLTWGAGLALVTVVGGFIVGQWGQVQGERASRLWLVVSLAGLALLALALWGLTGLAQDGD